MTQDHKALLVRAYRRIEELERRLAGGLEPIAVVGIGCRFPGGVVDADSYWALLSGGVDAIREVPPDRWDLEAYYDPDPEAPGKMYTRWGGFLDDLASFDAAFFGISGREALSMDPQQRLLLEVAWEALEDAGLAADRLAGTETGVFVGSGQNEYARVLEAARADPEEIGPYLGTGNATSVAAGRLSYVLGLRGPSLVVDTACSSSLVAAHLACLSLRAGECRLALAGGVNAILAPEVTLHFCRARMMAADGRCKTFDRSADGYVRGEGCGLVVLKRLADALADGDRVRAVIAGSAVNQDGRSAGLTAPNGLAQEAVIRKALAAAGVEGRDVGYVEAHGTGTALGDPIEIQALAAALGPDRPPLAVGSVKTNIGHLEAAAGVAALVKAVLALEREEIPPHLHFREPNPHLAWERLPITVPTRRTPWPRGETRRFAGVSSFGFSGTNAHLVVAEAPEVPAAAAAPGRSWHVLPLSARTPSALAELARRFDACLAGGASVADVCRTAAVGRAHHRWRLAAVGRDAGELREALRAAVPTETDPARREVAFILAAPGGQDSGMGVELARGEPAFREAFEQGGGPAGGLVAFQQALRQLWRSWGVGSGEGLDAAGRLPLEIGPLPSGGEVESVLRTLASLYARGADVDWRRFARGRPGRTARIPGYPFERRRHWPERPLEVPASWFHEVVWRPMDPPVGRAESGRWLVAGDGVRFEGAVRIGPGDELPPGDWAGLLHAVALEAPDDLEAICRSALEFVQRAAIRRSTRIWFATRATPAGSALRGFARTVALEHPDLWGGIVEFGPGPEAGEAEALAAFLGGDSGEDQVAFRQGRWSAARLVRREAPRGTCRLDPERAYLVTGGTGALGLEVAAWLVERGARRRALGARRDPSAEARARIARLQERGARVDVSRVDVSVRADVDRWLAGLSAPLAGVVHAAGALDDGVIASLDWTRFQNALAAKATGAWNLHEATLGADLDFFVLFSSSAGLLGSPGQANYAAANAFLDGLAPARRAMGRPATSVAWGAWGGAGMAARAGGHVRRRAGTLDPARAILALDRIVAERPERIAVLPVDWAAVAPPEAAPRLLSELLQPRPEASGARVRDELASLPREARPARLAAWLVDRLSAILAVSRDAFPVRMHLQDVGLDSLLAMEVVNAVKRDLGVSLYPRELFERPTVEALAGYLAAELDRPVRAAAPDAEGALLATPAPPPPRRRVRGRNPPAAFVLSAPRSGSTLLRVMLAGHPGLFSPPELHLLPFDGMADRERALAGSWLGEGLQRALMDLEGVPPDVAGERIRGWVAGDLPIQEVYRHLQGLSGDRLLVDKSPTYALQLETLLAAETLFESPRYVLLFRHPHAVVESFVRVRMDRMLAGGGGGDPHRLAEEIWTTACRNLLEFARRIDPSRRRVVRYEDLVRDPEPVARDLCEFLGVAFDPRVLEPYAGERMTRGVHERSAPIGDPNFASRSGIDRSLADSWREVELPAPISPPARALSAELGYELPAPPALRRREERVEIRGLSLAVRTWGEAPRPLALVLHGILDDGGAWERVARGLVEAGLRVVAPDQRGHGRSDHLPPAASYHLVDLVADAEALVDRLASGPVLLVGHSMGAAVAALLAASRPEAVRSLVLVEPVLPPASAGTDPVSPLRAHLAALRSSAAHPVFHDLDSAVERLRRIWPALDAASARETAERLAEPCPGGFRWRWDARLASRAGLAFDGLGAGRDALLATFARVVVPTTIVHGERSPFDRPGDRADLRTAFPGARVVGLAGGHDLHLEVPEHLAREITRADGS